MSIAYRLMYLVGFTPWDTGEIPAELKALVEGQNALAPERALDVGCGTGTQSGWELASAETDSGADPGGPLRDVPRTWYRFLRRP